MKTVFQFLLVVFALVLVISFLDKPPSNEMPKQIEKDPNIVAYDWEYNRNITKAMADTMIFTGGHWYGKSNPPKTRRPPDKSESKKVKWLRPAGNESHYRESKAAEKAWLERQQQEDKPEPLTEDDVRQLIITEYER